MSPRTPKRSADFVTVGCRLPQGMTIPLKGLNQPIKLHGTHSPFARFGCGMTEVKAEHWDAIKEQYGERDGKDRNGDPARVPQAAWLANEIVFAADDPRSAAAEAKEKEDERVGFEPIDTTSTKTIGLTPGLAGIKIQPDGADDPGQPGLN